MTADTSPARKAAPRKRAASLAAPSTARKRTAGKATNVEPLSLAAGPAATPAPGPAAPTVTWRGRVMPVRLPTGEQLAVLRRTYDRLSGLSDADVAHMDGEQGSRLLGRVLRVILTVLADEQDREWLEDEMLDGRVTLNDAADLVPLAVAQFRDRAPATGPTPKARRRA